MPNYQAMARPLYPELPSNRVPVAGFAAGVVLARLQGQGWKEAAFCGVEAFTVWAAARELDPDRPASAAAATALALAWQVSDGVHKELRQEDAPTLATLLTGAAHRWPRPAFSTARWGQHRPMLKPPARKMARGFPREGLPSTFRFLPSAAYVRLCHNAHAAGAVSCMVWAAVDTPDVTVKTCGLGWAGCKRTGLVCCAFPPYAALPTSCQMSTFTPSRFKENPT